MLANTDEPVNQSKLLDFKTSLWRYAHFTTKWDRGGGKVSPHFDWTMFRFVRPRDADYLHQLECLVEVVKKGGVDHGGEIL